MRHQLCLGSTEVTAPTIDNECVVENEKIKVSQDRIVGELNRILGQLDCLGLYLAGAHVASAMEAVQSEGVDDQTF